MNNISSAKQVEILVVDENPDKLTWLQDLLIKAGYKVRYAKNGKEGLSFFTIDWAFLHHRLDVSNQFIK